MKAILCAALAVASVAACQTSAGRSGPLFQTAGIPGASAPPGAESGPNTGIPNNSPIVVSQPNTGTFATPPISLGSSDFLDGGSMLGTGGAGTAGATPSFPSSSGTVGDLGALDGGSMLGTGGSGLSIPNLSTPSLSIPSLSTPGTELGVDAGSF